MPRIAVYFALYAFLEWFRLKGGLLEHNTE